MSMSRMSRQRFISYCRTFLVPTLLVLAIVGLINSKSDSNVSRSESDADTLRAHFSELESMVDMGFAILCFKVI